MIPGRAQAREGVVRNVAQGNAAGWSGASSEDTWDKDEWGSVDEWDSAISSLEKTGDRSYNVNKIKGHMRQRRNPHGVMGHMSVPQFGSMPLTDTGGDITTAAGSTGDSAGV